MSVNLFGQNVGNASLNIDQNTQIVSGYIGTNNAEDYYRFNFSSRSSLNLLLGGLYGNADLQVLDSNGRELAGSYQRRNLDESISLTLETGDYYIRVFQVRNATTHYNLKYSSGLISPAPVSQNISSWMDTEFQNVRLRSDIKSFSADGVIDRNEVIRILRASVEDGVVNAIEFTDLKSLVSNASRLGMPEYVQVLANKVINGDVANQRYQQNSLGNLTVGSASTQMENLVNKWFLGSDYPVTPYIYKQASGSLFQNGVSYQDIKQGLVNDCYFLAGLAATALKSPATIQNMFIDNGDNTYTIRFFRNKVADYVTVDRYLPTDSSGRFVYVNKGSNYSNSTNELWVALAEKAYAQLNESGWIYQDNTNSYSGIGKSGYISDALSQITGQTVFMNNVLKLDSLINAINTGKLIGFGSKSSEVAPDVIPSHAYVLVNYDAAAQIFTLFNPWGIDSTSKPGILQLNWNQILASFSYWDAASNG
jgi:Calpain family cysteine protease/Bacterial pre-peptidase C-terminal domain